VAAPALLAVYLFRHRHRRVEVSTLLLWQSVARVRQGGRTLRRTRLPWLFFVELLFFVLCGLAAAGPRWLRPDSRRPLVVVVDDSASMGAKSGSHDRLAAARRIVRATAVHRRWSDVRYVLAGPTARRFEAQAALLEAWTAEAPSADLAAALRMARNLAGEEGQVLVVSDHSPGDGDMAGELVRWVAVGRQVENTAIVQAVRSPRDADTDHCLLGVAHYGPSARRAVLDVEWEQAPSERVEFDLPPGVPQFRTIVAPVAAGVGRFRLAGQGDALAVDGTVVLVPSPRVQVPVSLASADEALAEPVRAALAATGMATDCRAEDAALVVVAGDATVPPLAAGAWVLRIRAPAAARTLLGPFLRRHGHPLLEGMDLQGTAWGAASDALLAGDPILRAGNTALVAVGGEVNGGQRIELQFDPARSNLQRTPDWPVFFANLLAWRWASLPPGLAEPNLRSGLGVALRVPERVPEVFCTGPDGVGERLPTRMGAALWTPRHIGLHVLRWSADAAWPVGVNFVSPGESDLRNGAYGEWGAWRAPDATSRGLRDIAWVLLLMALLVLLAHHALLR
jgi:hypothetical protein